MSQISGVIDNLKEKVVSKGKEIAEYMEKHNIQIRHENENSGNEEAAKGSGDSKTDQPTSGVLMQH